MARKRANGEGTIRRREDRNGWEARYYDTKGKRHSVYGKTQAEVRKNLATAVAQSSVESDPEYEDLTLAEWLQIWQRDYLGNLKPGTAISYEMQVRVHIVPTLGDYTLAALKTPMIQKLYNYKLAHGLSQSKTSTVAFTGRWIWQ